MSSLDDVTIQNRVKVNVWWNPELQIIEWMQGNNTSGIEFSPVQGGWYQAQRVHKTPQFFKIPNDAQKFGSIFPRTRSRNINCTTEKYRNRRDL